MKEDDDNRDTIVAIRPCCGAIVFAAVNLPQVMDHKETKRDLADLVMEGCEIRHMPVALVRKAKWGCKCPK